MGQVSSHVTSVQPYNVDPKRFSVETFQCCVNLGDRTRTAPSIDTPSPALLTTHFDCEHNTLVSKRSDNRPVTLVQDPDSAICVLQLPYRPSLSLKFSIRIELIPGNHQYRLVFAHASSAQGLVQVLEKRQPENLVEIGVWTCPQQTIVENLDFMFIWDAQEDKPGGEPIHFAFFFDGTPLQHIAGATVWVSERQTSDFSEFYDPTQTPIEASTSLPCTPLVTSNATLTSNALPNSALPTSSTASPISPPLNTSSAILNSPGGGQISRPKQESMPYSIPVSEFKYPISIRPGAIHQFPADDGPQFRSAIFYMERQVPLLRARIKQILKRSLMCRERLQALIEAVQWLGSGIQETTNEECPGFKPIADWFSPKAESGLSAAQRQRKVSLNELTTRIIEPLQKFYETDIKPFEQRKREFEENSNQFYSWTSRYLANRKEGKKGKASEAADAKFCMKKRVFDIARLDYFTYLNDLTIGMKQQVLLQLLALAAQSLTDSHIALGSELSNRTQPILDKIVDDVKNATREWEVYRKENLQYRQSMIEESNSAEHPESAGFDRIGSPDLPGNQHPESPRNFKEGLLWAASRPDSHQDTQIPNKQALQNAKWHKYWVVLNGSSLQEFTNWKQSVVDLHNEPINLLVASVREARNNERRFCFEVVTPQYKRVYQATSEEEVRAWISAINKSICTLLEASDEQQPPLNGGPSNRDQTSPDLEPGGDIHSAFHTTSPKRSQNTQGIAIPNVANYAHVSPSFSPGVQNIGLLGKSPLSPHLGGIAIPLTNGVGFKRHSNEGSVEGSPQSDRMEKLTRKLSFKSGDRPRIPPITTTFQKANNINISAVPQPVTSPLVLQPSLNGSQASPDDLIRQLQRNPSNRICAECQTNQNVEWVSINLLVIVCIECSGAHRSLGSHISKIRSLKLDVSAFNTSLRAAFMAVSNDVVNEIWEAKLPQGRKLTPDASSSARKRYCSEKYIEKQYIDELEKPNALLRKAIQDQDIARICAALASRANPNGSSDADEPMLIHALRSANPNTITFPSAELLIKNGAIVPPVGAYTGLSKSAEIFLASKQ